MNETLRNQRVTIPVTTSVTNAESVTKRNPKRDRAEYMRRYRAVRPLMGD